MVIGTLPLNYSKDRLDRISSVDANEVKIYRDTKFFDKDELKKYREIGLVYFRAQAIYGSCERKVKLEDIYTKMRQEVGNFGGHIVYNFDFKIDKSISSGTRSTTHNSDGSTSTTNTTVRECPSAAQGIILRKRKKLSTKKVN